MSIAGASGHPIPLSQHERDVLPAADRPRRRGFKGRRGRPHDSGHSYSGQTADISTLG